MPACCYAVGQPWLGQGAAQHAALPRLSAIRTSRVTSEAAEVRETPRLVVDRLKGNVFVNQYLIIRDLGRGAHGTVKLVLDTEEQTVYAMKATHLAAGGSFHSNSSSPFAGAGAASIACRIVGQQQGQQQLWPFGSRRDVLSTSWSGSGARPASSCGQASQQLSSKEVQLPQLSDTDTAEAGQPAAAAAAATAKVQTFELMREMAVMKKLDHPHVVALHEVIHDPDAKLLIMVMEYMPGGPLLSSVGQGRTEPLPEAAARHHFRELVSGLDGLHSNLIMHGDLKPDNLLLSSEGQLKISDFGSAAVLPSSDALISTTLGTPAFMAPEMCGLNSSAFRPFPAECWALGASLFMFVYGRAPYVASSTGLLYERIRAAAPVQLPEVPAVSEPLAALLRGLLDKDPSSRMNLAEVCCHPWVVDGGKLLPVRRCCEQQAAGAFSPVCAGLSKAEQSQAVTGLKQQVKDAIPSVEERTYRKGQLLVEQGKVAEGFFLILQGTCELVLLNLEQYSGSGAANGPGGAAGGAPGGLGLLGTGGVVLPAVKKESDMDFAAELSDSTSDDDEEEEEGEKRPTARIGDAVAGTEAVQADGAEQHQEQQQQFAGAASLAHMLPDLLPAPRWQYTGAEYNSTNTDSNSSTPAAASGRPTPEPASNFCQQPRAAAASAGPVMIGAAQAAQAAAADARLSLDGRSSRQCSASGVDRHKGHSRSVDFSAFEGQQLPELQPWASVVKPDNTQRQPGPSMQHGLPPFFHSSRPSMPKSPLPGLDFRYGSLAQASVPDLRQFMAGGRSSHVPGSPGGAAGLMVQRSASSATMGKAFSRAMRRSESMHRRMKQLVVQAKMLTEHNAKRQELVGIRGPGQLVGDTTPGSRAVPATATVRARTKMKVLLVRRADAAALKHQPGIKAALYRTQTESSVLGALENFATYDNEVTTIDDLRKSLAATSSSFFAAAQLSVIAAASGYCGSQSQACGYPGPGPSSGAVPAGVGRAAGAVGAGSGCSSVGTVAAAVPASPRGEGGAALASSRVRSSPSFIAALAAAAGGAFGGTGGYNTASFSALGALRPASRGNSFTAAATQAAAQAHSSASAQGAAGASCPLPQQGSGVYAGSGCSTPSSSSPVLGASSSSSYGTLTGAMQHPAAPTRGSSSTRFALSAAASGSVPISRELSPVPSSTAAALAAAAREAAGVGSRQVSRRAMFQQQQQQQRQQ
ncbi:hypothetical protein COO60DRAFT_1693425 [Scenedesmus sp. NREL 46B-D3]|nr:hypothetical protein COO60DRAFT_1693425 [Scenedesmus sp. NREL 46B-D3]